MLADEHLTLRMVRLMGGETWAPDGLGAGPAQVPAEPENAEKGEPGDFGLCFVFIRSGAGMAGLHPVRHRLAAGDVLIFPAGSSVSLRPTGQSELVFANFAVLVEHLFPLCSVSEMVQLQQLSGNFKPVKFLAAGSPVAKDCHRIVGAIPPQFTLDHRAHLLRVAALILGEEFRSLHRSRPDFAGMEQHLLPVFEKFSANDLLTLSTHDLSAKFGCSRRHLSRLFHQYFGFSVATLRMELRMLRAISLLRDARVKVNQVAEQCGFNHYGAFNTCFKRRFGTSPSRWRAQRPAPPAPVPPPASPHFDCPLQPHGICPAFRISTPAGPWDAAAGRAQNSVPGAAPKRPKRLKELLAQPNSGHPPLAGAPKPVRSPRLTPIT